MNIYLTQLEQQLAGLKICKNCQFWTFQKEDHQFTTSQNRFERVGSESVAFIGTCSKRNAETGSFNRDCGLFQHKGGAILMEVFQ